MYMINICFSCIAERVEVEVSSHITLPSMPFPHDFSVYHLLVVCVIIMMIVLPLSKSILESSVFFVIHIVTVTQSDYIFTVIDFTTTRRQGSLRGRNLLN